MILTWGHPIRPFDYWFFLTEFIELDENNFGKTSIVTFELSVRVDCQSQHFFSSSDLISLRGLAIHHKEVSYWGKFTKFDKSDCPVVVDTI